MFRKKITISLLLLSSLYAKEIFLLEAKIDFSMVLDNNSKKHTDIGKVVAANEPLEYSSKVIGGDFGVNLRKNDLEFLLQGSGVTSLINRPSDDQKINSVYFDNDKKDFFYLSNIYLSQKFENINLKIGRQKYNNDLVNQNKRVTSNQYEGVYLDYKTNLFKINSFYFNKISSSPVANIVPFDSDYGVMGYGKGYKVGEFISVSKHISNKDYDTNGAIVSDITNTFKSSLEKNGFLVLGKSEGIYTNSEKNIFCDFDSINKIYKLVK